MTKMSKWQDLVEQKQTRQMSRLFFFFLNFWLFLQQQGEKSLDLS